MTLARRLLVLLLVSVPIVWAIAVGAAYLRSRHEINELKSRIRDSTYLLARLRSGISYRPRRYSIGLSQP